MPSKNLMIGIALVGLLTMSTVAISQVVNKTVEKAAVDKKDGKD